MRQIWKRLLCGAGLSLMLVDPARASQLQMRSFDRFIFDSATARGLWAELQIGWAHEGDTLFGVEQDIDVLSVAPVIAFGGKNWEAGALLPYLHLGRAPFVASFVSRSMRMGSATSSSARQIRVSRRICPRRCRPRPVPSVRRRRQRFRKRRVWPRALRYRCACGRTRRVAHPHWQCLLRRVRGCGSSRQLPGRYPAVGRGDVLDDHRYRRRPRRSDRHTLRPRLRWRARSHSNPASISAFPPARSTS